MCRQLAAALLGADAVPAGSRGLPRVPMHEGASPGQRVLFHVVEMCCLSETLTGVYFTEMLARATHPVARAAIESLLEDEIDHGRVGWAYLAERARARDVDGLAAALPAIWTAPSRRSSAPPAPRRPRATRAPSPSATWRRGREPTSTPGRCATSSLTAAARGHTPCGPR